MATLDLRKGFTDNNQYKGFKFPGGEVKIIIKKPESILTSPSVRVIAKANTSDDIMLLTHAVYTLKEDGVRNIEVFFPYFAYQQDDMKFNVGESFGLKIITNLLNQLPVDKYIVFDPHSGVTPALLKNCETIDNSEYVRSVIDSIVFNQNMREEDLILLSPDAGAYKKIGKLGDKIKFKGDIVAANKYRNTSSGNIESLELSKSDLNVKDVLIVDDICVGGRTFVELSKKLKEANAGKLYLAVSHGIFSNGLKELNQHFEKIFVTDSRLNYTQDREFLMFNEKEMDKLTVHTNG